MQPRDIYLLHLSRDAICQLLRHEADVERSALQLKGTRPRFQVSAPIGCGISQVRSASRSIILGSSIRPHGASMITLVSGDILLSKARVVAHGVAPNDEHASGLAHSLREHWPAMYKDFRHYCKTSHPKPGGLWTWAAADGHRIVALFTQEGAYHPGSRPGRASMTHVNHALHALRDLVLAERISSLALPRLATGVGGLSWDDVRPAIEKWLGALTIPISVYGTFRAGQAADEPIDPSVRSA